MPFLIRFVFKLTISKIWYTSLYDYVSWIDFVDTENIFTELDKFIVLLNSATVYVPYNVRSDDLLEIEHSWINSF